MKQLAESPRIRRSPYYEATIAAGATDWTVYNKMLLPLSYGDLDAEYCRLIDGVSMWDVACQRQVEVSGPEAGRLVQYLTARDLTTMKPGQGRYVALCDHDGSILNDPVLLKLAEDRYWFSIADADVALWARAVAAERGVNAVVSEPDVSPLAIQGPKAIDLAVDVFGPTAADIPFFGFVETELDGMPIVLCRSGWSHQGGFELFLRDGSRGVELWDRVAAAGAPYGIGPGAPNHVERVESGLLSYGGDNEPGSNPFEVGMGRFVDVDTPVEYIGKVALQKVAAEGPARLLVGVVLDEVPAGGELDGERPDPEPTVEWMLPQRVPITLAEPESSGDETVGTTGAVVRSPRLGRTIALAQIDRRVVDAGRPVAVVAPDGSRHRATITSLPFV